MTRAGSVDARPYAVRFASGSGNGPEFDPRQGEMMSNPRVLLGRCCVTRFMIR